MVVASRINPLIYLDAYCIKTPLMIQCRVCSILQCFYSIRQTEHHVYITRLSRDINCIYLDYVLVFDLNIKLRGYGPMDKASDYESGDSRFDPW
jgi:hypothetical protein